MVAEEVFDSLKAPIARVTAPDMQIPFSPALETGFYPTADSIVASTRTICGNNAPTDL